MFQLAKKDSRRIIFVQKLIALGAVHVVVPGIFPTGCLPIFLSLFGDGDADLDDAGCLKAYNLLTKYHNSMLRKQVEALQRRHRNSTRLMYADYYGLVYQMVQEPHKFGTKFSSFLFLKLKKFSSFL